MKYHNTHTKSTRTPIHGRRRKTLTGDIHLADLYGEDCYRAFLAREAQIKKMSLDTKRWPAIDIMHLHEKNYLLLKQHVIQPWFMVDFYGNMIPAPKSLPAMRTRLRAAI